MFVISKIQNAFYLLLARMWGAVVTATYQLFVKIYLGILLILNISVWVLAVLFKKQLTQNLIVLHFNVDSGVDLIGEASQIFLMPIIATLIALLNILLVFIFFKNKNFNFLAHILLAVALLANIFILMSFGPLYYINFR